MGGCLVYACRSAAARTDITLHTRTIRVHAFFLTESECDVPKRPVVVMHAPGCLKALTTTMLVALRCHPNFRAIDSSKSSHATGSFSKESLFALSQWAEQIGTSLPTKPVLKD